MSEINGDGPAFPIKERQEHLDGQTVCEEWPGLSKREWFAGQALQGFFSGIPFDSETPMTEADDKYLQEVARVCFKMAGAMLAESQK